MSQDALKLLVDAAREQEKIANKYLPALDEILLFSLERKYLGLGAFTDIFLEQSALLKSEDLTDRLRHNVRLMRVDEICYERGANFHLAGVESVLSSMRECGHSLVFMVSGEPDRATVYLGLSQFSNEPLLSIDEAIRVYESAWSANFPGTVLQGVPDTQIRELSTSIGLAQHCGFLTGLPSLKREEARHDFVQGLERLIRALRGRSYSWMSIADPIDNGQMDQAIEACRRLTGDVHRLVKTGLTKGVSSSKTVMAGMFGMLGCGDTDGKAYSVTDSESKSHTDGTTQQHLEDHQRAGKGIAAVGTVAGAIIGSIICPGVGTMIGGFVGGAVGTVVTDLGDAITGKSGYAKSVSDTITSTRSFTNTASQAVSRQIAGGGFGSFGMTWTRTTSITQDLLNRKAEYCEELLRLHETRLLSGRATGMWTVGHYFCSEDPTTYEMGHGVLRSLFSGMDSQYEPPRITGLPPESTTLLRRFANIYLSFPNEQLKRLLPGVPPRGYVVASHPLGFVFNGVGTPLSTSELAIATPLPAQEAEGISVSRRASFGVNAPVNESEDSLTLGDVLDHGDPTRQRIRLKIANLPKHVGVFGLTGSGKTTTVQSMLNQLWEKHRIPFMVIEPAKSEYRRLAAAQSLIQEMVVLTAGVESKQTCPLRLNPFSFTPPDDDGRQGVHLLTHIDRLRAIFNASFPMYASMPYLLEEALMEIYQDKGWDLTSSRNRYISSSDPALYDYFPMLQDLHVKIDSVVKRKGYWVEQEKNLSAALKTRIASLMAGAKGTMLNCQRSFSDSDIFENPVVIELRHIGDDDEKVFLMGLLLLKLYEYRESQMEDNRPLKHFLVIEEAHRLLADIPNTGGSMESANMRGKGVSSFIDMLSEIRAYGQGVAVVDQVPGRLHPYIVKGTGTKIVHRLLAKDDREMVGHTMGLDEDQMSDLGLLNEGECIFHQDGVRKAFLCKVKPGALLNLPRQMELNEGTLVFREKHEACIGSKLDSVMSTSWSPTVLIFFHDLLMKAMAASVFVPPADISKALAGLVDSLPDNGRDAPKVHSQIFACWRQITDEAWHFHGGDYSAFLEWRNSGRALLNAWGSSGPLDSVVQSFKEAANLYHSTTPRVIGRSEDDEIARVYDQLITRMEVVLTVAHASSSASKCGQSVADSIGEAIAREMTTLFPSHGFSPSLELVVGLARAIAARITERKHYQAQLEASAVQHYWRMKS